MMPESTSPVPAVASAGTPAPARKTSGAVGPAVRSTWSGHRGERPLEEDDGPHRVGKVTGGRQPVVAGRRPGQAGVLTVVRREDGRMRTLRQERAGALETTEGGDGVGVDHQRMRGGGDDGADLLLRRLPCAESRAR